MMVKLCLKLARISRYILILFVALLAASCSTTKMLRDGEYRLAMNKVQVTNDKHFNGKSLEPYIQQYSGPSFIRGWHPFLCVYNWQNGKGKGWDKLVQKIGVAPVIYDSETVMDSESSIANHLEYVGYFNSKVEASVAVKKRNVFVTYNVTLGKQYPIESLTWSVPEGEFKECFDADTNNISVKIGEPLSESALEDETVRSSKYFRDNGFFGFNKTFYTFEADTLAVPGAAQLEMRVKEYPRNASPDDAKTLRKYTIGNVTFSHPQSLKIRPKVLSGLNLIMPGDMYSESLVNDTYQRLTSIKVFNSVNINLQESDDDKVDCTINLTQGKLQGVKLNLEGSTNSSGLFGISPQLSYYHKNIFHGGEWLNLSFMGNFQFKIKDKIKSNEFGVSAGLSLPKFLFLPYRLFKGSIPRTDFNMSYNYQNRPEYTRNIVSASYGYTGSYKEKFQYKFYPLQLNIVHLFNLDSDFYESISKDPFLRNAYNNHFDFGTGGTLYYTTDTGSSAKTSPFYARLQLDLAGNILSAFRGVMKKDEEGHGLVWNTPFSQFVRFEATVGKTWKFGRNYGQAVATRLVAGAGFAYGNSSALPFEKHFYGGGANSLRGWQTRSVGPGFSAQDTYFVIPNQSGDMKIEANVEYRFDLFWKLEGATFVDAGNVWNMPLNHSADRSEESLFHWNNFYKSIAANWGIGLRADFNFLIIRVDWGMKVHDPSRTASPWMGPRQWVSRDGYAVHFGVGYPF